MKGFGQEYMMRSGFIVRKIIICKAFEIVEVFSLVCRGHKTVVKFFSSEVADLEPVLALLLRCDAEVSPLLMSALPPVKSY